MDTPIVRAEHEEFMKRMESEHQRLHEADERQDERISILEKTFDKIMTMTSNIERLATNMENMAKEQESQGKRLATLEKKDGESWHKFVWYVTSAAVGGIVVFLLKQIGIV